MSKRKKIYLIYLLALVAAIICLLFLTGLTRFHCPLEFIILKETELSNDWKVFESDIWPAYLPQRDRLGAEKAYRTILKSKRSDTIGHTLYRYSSGRLASFHMWFDKAVFFPTECMDWETESETLDWLTQADRFLIRCGTATCSNTANNCTALARYGNYISHLSFTSGNRETTNVAELIDLMVKVDEQFNRCAP